MIDPADTPEDAALRRLYRAERPEPDTRLDDAILDAARAAVAAPPRRKWRYPVGVGAAASALLAVLIFQQPSETVVELERIKAAPASEASPLPQSKPNYAVEAVRVAAPASPPAAAPAELARELVAEADTDDASPALHKLSVAPMRVHQESAADSAVSSVSACEADSTTIATDGLMLCITDDLIEAHDLAMGCAEPLSLSRPVKGAVSIERAAHAVTISIANEPYWRVQCQGGNWRVDALR